MLFMKRKIPCHQRSLLLVRWKMLRLHLVRFVSWTVEESVEITVNIYTVSTVSVILKASLGQMFTEVHVGQVHHTLRELLPLSSAMEMGRRNEYFCFAGRSVGDGVQVSTPCLGTTLAFPLTCRCLVLYRPGMQVWYILTAHTIMICPR